MDDVKLREYEELSCTAPHCYEKVIILELVMEVRRLEHELRNPNYLYADSRISRGAIITRDAEISQLRSEILALKGGK